MNGSPIFDLISEDQRGTQAWQNASANFTATLPAVARMGDGTSSCAPSNFFPTEGGCLRFAMLAPGTSTITAQLKIYPNVTTSITVIVTP